MTDSGEGIISVAMMWRSCTDRNWTTRVNPFRGPFQQITTILSILLVGLSVSVEGQTPNRNASLIAVQCIPQNGVCGKQRLLRFDFKNGELVSQSTVFTSANVRFDLGRNHIYQNKFVISNWGDVVDVENKSLLHKSAGKYVAAEGNRVIINVNRVDVHGYFYFDLQRKSYARLPAATKWALPGLLSPNQTKSVDGEAFNISLHQLDRKEILLGRDFNVFGDVRSSSSAVSPLFWLDDEHLLTQKNNGEIVVLRLNGAVTPIVKIPIEVPTLGDPRFFRDGVGRIIYECSGQSFIIDVDNRSYAPYRWLALNSQFEVANERDNSYGHIIRFAGKEIGRLWGLVWTAPTTNNYFAVEYGPVGSNLGYPEGIQVWSSANGTWTTIKLRSLMNVIGWIES